MEKVIFALEIEDGWPPVAAEGVWCEVIGDLYKLKSTPVFIKGLAVGDIFRASPDPINHQIFDFSIDQPSGRSLIWFMENENGEDIQIENDLIILGCKITHTEGVPVKAVDVPENVDLEKLDSIIEAYQNRGVSFAFPVWRH